MRPFAAAVRCVHERMRQLDQGVDRRALELAHQQRLLHQRADADAGADGRRRGRPPVAGHGVGIDEQHDVLALPWPSHLAELLEPLVLAVIVERFDVGPRFAWRECDRLQRRTAVGAPLLHPVDDVERDRLADLLLVAINPLGGVDVKPDLSRAREARTAAAAAAAAAVVTAGGLAIAGSEPVKVDYLLLRDFILVTRRHNTTSLFVRASRCRTSAFPQVRETGS